MLRRPFSVVADDGQTMAEYTFVLGMITLAIVTTISLLSGRNQRWIHKDARGRAIRFLMLEPKDHE